MTKAALAYSLAQALPGVEPSIFACSLVQALQFKYIVLLRWLFIFFSAALSSSCSSSTGSSSRTISAEGRAGQIQNAISPAFRALDTHDLRRWLRAPNPKRDLACISRPRRARSPQRVAWDKSKTALDTHDLRRGLRWTGQKRHLHFAPSTRAISAEGCVSWCSVGRRRPRLKRERKEEREDPQM